MNTEAILQALKTFIEEIESQEPEVDNPLKEKIDLFVSSVKPISGRIFNDAPMSLQETGEALVSRLKSANDNLEEKVDFAIYFIVEVMLERAIRVGSVQTGGPEQLLDYVFNACSSSKSIDVMLKASLGGTVIRVIQHDRDAINGILKNAKDSSRKFFDDSTSLLAEKEKVVAQKIFDFDERVAKVEGRLEGYIKQVQDLQGELSFLALGKAFTTFITEKAKEKRNLLFVLVTIAISIVSIPIGVFVKVILSPDMPIVVSADVFSAVSKLYYLFPITVAEVILIFYFRILLGQFNAVNAQLLQLKMRLSICQFIESYVDFKGDNGQHNLEKFESLVFSNLMPSAEQVPSTFDGLEHLGKAIASLKK